MTASIVLVSQDSRGRTEARWYLDLEEWEAGRPIALISANEHWVDDELADREVRRMVNRLSENEFEASHSPDLSWLATHRQPIAGDPPQPVTPCPMAPACSLPADHQGRHSLSLDRVSDVDATNVRRLIAEADRDGAA